jgi:hypothetical protein
MTGFRTGLFLCGVAAAIAACSADTQSSNESDGSSSETTGSSSSDGDDLGGGRGDTGATGSSAIASATGTTGTTGGAGVDVGAGEGGGSLPGDGSGGEGGQSGVEPGTLTAGVWDDNRNFDFFLEYVQGLRQDGLAGLLDLSDDDFGAAHDFFSMAPGPRQTLDVSLVIDTTGSMSDEINYLQTEFIAITNAIEERYPNSEQRWSLVVYRDEGDAYVVDSFDFEDDPAAFQQHLGAQSADGGGDFPEAPDAGLARAAELDWRDDGDTARLAFWVADAPHHEQNAQAMVDAIEDLQALDVHVYPVASSGVDELTEVTMRSAAQLTGGRYLFLTDDSGVGGAHKEPTIPCYFVTKLDSAIVRMIDIELSGEYREPAGDEIIREGGDPQDRACELESGQTVEAY